MDNSGSNAPQRDNREGPLSAGGKAEEPIRLEESPAAAAPGVSRAPLNLGGGTAAPTPAPATPPAAAPAPAPAARAAAPAAAPAPRPPVPGVRPAGPRPVAAPRERISACKVFFTKLHPGAIKFLEEQITNWLKENPSVVIKSTDVIMGEVQEKKTEPNIVIVVWY
jgi:hypothetical protein